jgi:hypothetical protein
MSGKDGIGGISQLLRIILKPLSMLRCVAILDSWFLNRKDGVTMYPKQSLYSRLSNDEKYEDNGSETHGSSYAPQLSKSRRRGPGLFIKLNASILLISIITLAVSIMILRRSKSDYSNDMNVLLKKTSFYCEPLLIQIACQN